MKHHPLFVVLAAFASVASAEASQPVAMVLSQPVEVAEIDPRPDVVTRQKAGLDAEAFAQWLIQARAKQLAAQVQKRLLDSYAERHRLKPTEAELRPVLRTFEKTSKEVEESMRRVRQQRVEEIRKKLKAPALDAAERARLTADLASWERIPIGLKDQAREADPMISNLVQHWKVQRSLYQSYGGRVLLSSFGFNVAIDAMKQFLREEEKRGSFEIFDPGLRAAFWTAVADEAWADGVTTGRSADEVFATPPWQVEDRRP